MRGFFFLLLFLNFYENRNCYAGGKNSPGRRKNKVAREGNVDKLKIDTDLDVMMCAIEQIKAPQGSNIAPNWHKLCEMKRSKDRIIFLILEIF